MFGQVHNPWVLQGWEPDLPQPMCLPGGAGGGIRFGKGPEHAVLTAHPVQPTMIERKQFMSNFVNKPSPAEKPAVGFVERPWGSFNQFAFNQDCTVSLMTVKPGQRLSLQSHTGRAELWIVIDDGAVVQVGDHERECKAGDEIWIPASEKHRLSCQGGLPVRVLEVAFGNWQQ
jgi:mannose-1-phosphate guanylyltransferase/mannose-6-phosphate isomerase